MTPETLDEAGQALLRQLTQVQAGLGSAAQAVLDGGITNWLEQYEPVSGFGGPGWLRVGWLVRSQAKAREIGALVPAWRRDRWEQLGWPPSQLPDLQALGVQLAARWRRWNWYLASQGLITSRRFRDRAVRLRRSELDCWPEAQLRPYLLAYLRTDPAFVELARPIYDLLTRGFVWLVGLSSRLWVAELVKRHLIPAVRWLADSDCQTLQGTCLHIATRDPHGLGLGCYDPLSLPLPPLDCTCAWQELWPAPRYWRTVARPIVSSLPA